MRKLAVLFLSLALTCTMAASTCAQSAIEIDFMHFNDRSRCATSADIDVFYSIFDQWTAAHPDVTVNETYMQQADYATKIQAMAAAGDMPDMFFVKGSWASVFADNGVMYPLNDYIETLAYKDSYRDGIFDALTVDGKIYASPYQFAITSVVYYNSELWASIGYDAFPTTWDDFFAANALFKEKGVYTVALGNKAMWPYESCILSALGDRFTGADWTGHIIDNDGGAAFTDQAFVDALALSQKMAAEGCFNPDFNTITNDQAYAYFLNGRAATSIEGFWAVSYYNANGDAQWLDKVETAVLPAVDGGAGAANSTSGGCGWYVAVNSALQGEKLDACLDFLFALTGEGFSQSLAEKYGLAAPVVVPDVDASAFGPLTQKYLKLMGQMNFTPIYDIMMEGSVVEVMNSGIQELLNGTVTPGELAARIQAEQEDIL